MENNETITGLFRKKITCGKCGKHYTFKKELEKPSRYICSSAMDHKCESHYLREDVLLKMCDELGGIDNVESIDAIDYDLTFNLKDNSSVKLIYHPETKTAPGMFVKKITCAKCGRYYTYKKEGKIPSYICVGATKGLCKSKALKEDVLANMCEGIGGLDNITSISASDYDITFTLKDNSKVTMTYEVPKKESKGIFGGRFKCAKCGRDYLWKSGYKAPYYVCAGVPRGLCKTTHIREDELVKMCDTLGGIDNVVLIEAKDLELTFTLKDNTKKVLTYIIPRRTDSWDESMRKKQSQMVSNIYNGIQENLSVDKLISEYNETIEKLNDNQFNNFVKAVMGCQVSFNTFFDDEKYEKINIKIDEDKTLASIFRDNTKNMNLLHKFAIYALKDWSIAKMISIEEQNSKR